MTREMEALSELKLLKVWLDKCWPDEAVTRIYEILSGYSHAAWEDLSEEFFLVDDETARLHIEELAKDELGVERISSYLKEVKKSGDWYKSNNYGYLMEITKEDVAWYLARAIEMVSES